MKTAISIPNDVFDRAEQLAKRLKKSRSQVYREAICEYLARYDEDTITAAINRVVDDPAAADPELDAFVAAWAKRTLSEPSGSYSGGHLLV